MPPGGHIENRDRSPIAASRREAFEETDLRVRKGQRVAELRVRIDSTRTKVRVQIIKFTEWTGRFKNKSGEFKWLEFIQFSKIPWKLMPGERQWYEDVVMKGKRRLVHIHCGTDRKDVISVRSRPLP
jgi:8-oxo-dGTP pyrophosphatase MutT (NUDIX family)